MRFVHRLTATITSVLLLLLSLQGSGTLCPMHGGDATARGAHVHSMDASMPGMGSTAPSALGAPATCASMTACAVSMVASAATSCSVAARVVARDLPEPLSAKGDLAIAPELPPPRA